MGKTFKDRRDRSRRPSGHAPHHGKKRPYAHRFRGAPPIQVATDWGRHTEEVRPSVRQLDLQSAASVAHAPDIPVTNAVRR
jgi:hypothetical protein